MNNWKEAFSSREDLKEYGDNALCASNPYKLSHDDT